MSASARSILREAAFLRLWAGTTASGLATWALPFLLGLAVAERSLSAPDLGLALAARTVGFLAAVPAGGVLADRWSRRAVVGWSAAAAAVASPLAALGLGTSTLLLAGAAAVVGAGQGACRPAFQALTAEVVDPDRRQQANAAVTIAVRVSVLVAPSAAALAALVVDVRALVVVTGLLWLAAAVLPPRGAGRAAPSGRTGFLREFAEGLAEARRHPWFVAGLAALTVVIATGYSATGVALPLISRDRYGTEIVLAAATTAYTAGALLGALLIARWRPPAPGWVALGGLAGYAVAPLALLLPVPAVLVVAAYLLTGIGIELFNVPWFTATQREVEPRLLARVSSVDFLFSYGLAPLGLALIAPAMTTVGTGPVLLACTIVCALAPAAAMLAPGSRAFHAPSSAPNQAR
jgi:MFS family permease